MEKFQSRVIYKGLSQFTGNSTTKSIVTLVARLRFCFPQMKKKRGRGGVVKEREKQKKKKKNGKRGKFIYRSRFPLLFISFVARLKTRAAINRNWRNSLCILLADSIGGTILFEIYASLKNRLAKNTMYLPALFNNDPCPIMLGIWCIELGKACIFPIARWFPLVRSIRSLVLVCPRYIVPKPYFSKIIHDTPNARTRIGAYWLCESDGVLVGCKNPIIIELLVQKRIREKEKKKRKGKIKGLYVCNFKQFNSIEFARILSFLGWCLKVVLEWQDLIERDYFRLLWI